LVDANPSGICRTDATLEWELLANWADSFNLGLNWDMGQP
jgi:hypothetical protein